MKNYIKCIFIFIFSMCFIFALSGCGGNNDLNANLYSTNYYENIDISNPLVEDEIYISKEKELFNIYKNTKGLFDESYTEPEVYTNNFLNESKSEQDFIGLDYEYYYDYYNIDEFDSNRNIKLAQKLNININGKDNNSIKILIEEYYCDKYTIYNNDDILNNKDICLKFITYLTNQNEDNYSILDINNPQTVLDYLYKDINLDEDDNFYIQNYSIVKTDDIEIPSQYLEKIKNKFKDARINASQIDKIYNFTEINKNNLIFIQDKNIKITEKIAKNLINFVKDFYTTFTDDELAKFLYNLNTCNKKSYHEMLYEQELIDIAYKIENNEYKKSIPKNAQYEEVYGYWDEEIFIEQTKNLKIEKAYKYIKNGNEIYSNTCPQNYDYCVVYGVWDNKTFSEDIYCFNKEVDYEFINLENEDLDYHKNNLSEKVYAKAKKYEVLQKFIRTYEKFIAYECFDLENTTAIIRCINTNFRNYINNLSEINFINLKNEFNNLNKNYANDVFKAWLPILNSIFNQIDLSQDMYERFCEELNSFIKYNFEKYKKTIVSSDYSSFVRNRYENEKSDEYITYLNSVIDIYNKLDIESNISYECEINNNIIDIIEELIINNGYKIIDLTKTIINSVHTQRNIENVDNVNVISKIFGDIYINLVDSTKIYLEQMTVKVFSGISDAINEKLKLEYKNITDFTNKNLEIEYDYKYNKINIKEFLSWFARYCNSELKVSEDLFNNKLMELFYNYMSYEYLYVIEKENILIDDFLENFYSWVK